MKALPFISIPTLALASPRITDTSIAPNSSTTPAPTTPGGTYCECGYTYCASVLMAMSKSQTQPVQRL
ncbi:hypothetical protein MHUMG1_07558 [Metarhizium humberi]|uniref:Uncharacterized protein n=1 Tax=Metarhizium humberi TaxID=2596975 RepID=A0A9P8S5X7_9HYPO|nr:hypothetical protein MHUMG1_07558 [Metarhizium humberi]